MLYEYEDDYLTDADPGDETSSGDIAEPDNFEKWWGDELGGPVHAAAKDAWEESARQTRETDAALVKAAGCLCRSLWLASRRARHTCGYDGDYRYEGDDFVVIRHDSRCPETLAAKILEAK